MADKIKIYRKDLEGFYEVTPDEYYKSYNGGDPLMSAGYQLTEQAQELSGGSVTYDKEKGLAEAKTVYGFFDKDLVEEYAKNWSRTGDANTSIVLTRQSAVWEKQFGYLKREDGSLVMSELDALSNIASYKNTLSEYDIKDFTLFEDKFKKLVQTEVAPLEFQQRMDLVANQVLDDIPKVRDLFAREYNIDVTDSAILGALINEDVQDGIFANQIKTLQIEAEAASRGFSTSFEKFQELRRSGFTREMAKNVYSSAGSLINQAQNVGRDLGIETLEQSALGNQEAINRVNRIQAEIQSKQGLQLGSKKINDEVTGLIED